MRVGKNVQIDPTVLIFNDDIIIGDNVRIDAYTKLNARCKIGNYVHIPSYCDILGGGEFIMEDYSNLSSGCKIITGTDDYSGSSMAGAMIPKEYKRNTRIGNVIMRKHSILGVNCVVMPDVEIKEGAAVGACSFVNKSLGSWSIYAGIPAKIIRRRPEYMIKQLERKLCERI